MQIAQPPPAVGCPAAVIGNLQRAGCLRLHFAGSAVGNPGNLFRELRGQNWHAFSEG